MPCYRYNIVLLFTLRYQMPSLFHHLDFKSIHQPWILIFGNYRSGTSALSAALGTVTHRQVINEPLDEPMANYQQFLDLIDHRSPFIASIHPDQLHKLPLVYLDKIKDQAFKIKLYRENAFDQILSLYFAVMTGVYSMNSNKGHSAQQPGAISYDLENLVVDKSDLTLEFAISNIETNRQLHQNQDIRYDIVLKYEDIADKINCNLVKLPKVKNHQDIVDWAKTHPRIKNVT